VIIDADQITHDLQQPGGAAYTRIVEAFGKDVVRPNGALDRRKLAELIFGNEEKRKLLNSIVHPLVREEEMRLLEEHRAERLVVLMVPLLFEVGIDSLADKTLVVTVDEETRLRRLHARSGMSAEEAGQRLATQLAQEEKVKRADYVITNGGTLVETERQVRELLSKLGIEPAAEEA